MTAQPKINDVQSASAVDEPQNDDAFNPNDYMQLRWQMTLLALAREYASIVLASVVAIWLISMVSSLVLAAMLYLVIILINGALIHRLALLGHEGSHGCLASNKVINDVLAEWLCFFPLFGSLSRYREVHRRHHQFTNLAHKDPNLDYGKHLWWASHFSSPHPSDYYRLHALILWPAFAIKQVWDLLRKGSLRESQEPAERSKIPKAAALGIVYAAVLTALVHTNLSAAIVWAVVSFGICLLLPISWFPLTSVMAYQPRWTALMRVAYLAVLLVSIGYATDKTGIDFFHWYFMLWLMPLLFVFPYLMFIREAYQHGGRGTGRYDNSRNMELDPIRRWAILGYGNELHQTHHLLPSVPHYRLSALDRVLKDTDPEYQKNVQKVARDGVSLQCAMYPRLSESTESSNL